MMNKQGMVESPDPTHPNTTIIQIDAKFHNRRLVFSGAKNFRDLGGYQTTDGRSVRWGALYRSDSLHQLTDADLKRLSELGLDRIVDFRSTLEKEKMPDRLPLELVPRLVEIPILDTSTQLLKNHRDEIFKNLKSIDPVHFLTSTNIDLATRFTPEMRQFIDVLIESNGRPVLFHCTAGKDRTGFAAAIILRILGVLPETVMQDYLLTNQYYFPSHRWRLYLLRAWKGKQVAATVTGMLRADHSYLSAGFQAIDSHYGSFKEYVRTALKLTDLDVEHLRSQYLE